MRVICAADPYRMADDFPVVIDKHGPVVSRFSDFSWLLPRDLGPNYVINFGDGPQRAGSGKIDSLNAFILRRIVTWWLHGPRAFESPATIRTYFTSIRPIFVLCSNHGIAATDLARHPFILEKIPSALASSKLRDVFMLLHDINSRSRELGFTLLDDSCLKRLNAAFPNHQARQTPYIPARIWLYQATRLKEFIDDFLRHQKAIEDCFNFCLEAYATYHGGLAKAFESTMGYAPFSISAGRAKYIGSFLQTAESFGIAELLQKWAVGRGDEDRYTICSLSNYLTAATRVAAAYITNMSLMRIGEVWALYEHCLVIEHDADFGPIYTLSGRTSKTITDDDARWVTTPSAAAAVEVACAVANLRFPCALVHPKVRHDVEKGGPKRIFLSPYEPWLQRHTHVLDVARPGTYPSYRSVVDEHPKILSVEELRITAEDLEIANLINPDLNRAVFKEGEVWPLAWHQLRRTGAVNMQSSGLVSDPSMQYQLKHATRAMSLYYGRGYGKVRLRRDAVTTYVRTMYEVMGVKLSSLVNDAFVSPHGDARKKQILELVCDRDRSALNEAAKTGSISWRETLFGGCTKRGPCSYGGIDNVIRCGGGDGKEPCADAIFDKRKVPQILRLRKIVVERINCAEMDTPLHESLQGQLRSIDRTLDELR